MLNSFLHKQVSPGHVILYVCRNHIDHLCAVQDLYPRRSAKHILATIGEFLDFVKLCLFKVSIGVIAVKPLVGQLDPTFARNYGAERGIILINAIQRILRAFRVLVRAVFVIACVLHCPEHRHFQRRTIVFPWHIKGKTHALNGVAPFRSLGDVATELRVIHFAMKHYNAL